MRESELPGEFVSDDLRADCARFLKDHRALIRRRADVPSGETEWVPGRVESSQTSTAASFKNQAPETVLAIAEPRTEAG